MRTILIVVGVVALVAPMSLAQYATSFEALNASAAGVLLADPTVIPIGTATCGALPAAAQDCYYVPAVASSPFRVYTYAGNALGVAGNPLGGCKFAGGISANPTFARCQRDFVLAGPSTYTIRADVCGRFNGTGTPINTLGSISFQSSAIVGAVPISQNFTMLARWPTVAPTGATWDADLLVATAFGTGAFFTVFPANPAFHNRPINTWNRWEVDVNFSTHAIVAVRITDLTTGITDTEIPSGWFLGGAATASNPIGYRLFAGGGAGNVFAADNVCIDATGACPGLPVLPAPAGYQVNQAIATCDINGATGSASCPAVFTSSFAAGTMINVNMNSAGLYDLAIDIGPSYPASSPIAITLPDLQIFNLNLLTTFWLSGAGPTPAFAGPQTLSFGAPPPGLVVTAQLVGFGIGALGVGLSQPVTLVCGP